MKVTHNDGVTLEHIVSNLYDCNQGGMGGIIDASHFERNPFHAALICISKLYSGMFDDKIDQFACTWETVFNYPDENQGYTIEQYITELRELISILK
jgi:hypothetical protein